MSKAFTKDDDDASFEAPRSSLSAIPAGPFRLTYTGRRLMAASPDPRVRETLDRAETLPRVVDPERAVLGVTVVATTDAGEKRKYRLVSPEERAIIGEGCSVEGPIGRVLVGSKVGDVCEVTLPRGNEELEIVALEQEPE